MINSLMTTLKNKKVMITAIAIIIILLFAFKTFAASKTSQDVQADNTIAVEVQQAKMTNDIAGPTYKANLEAAEEATISSNVSGLVKQVLFEDGDKVSQGQVIAYLDDKNLQNQLQSAQIDLSKLQLDLDAAKNTFDIAKELYANGACSRISFEDAERAYQTVQANVELKRISIQDINNSLNDYAVKSPISGEIGEKGISLGQFVNPGTVIAKVKNNTTIVARIQLMQDDLNKVMTGQQVKLKLSRDEETSYQGTVKTIAASADSQTRVFDCLIEIDNRSGALNSGTFGYIEIPDNTGKQVLVVPMAAVTGSEGDYSVFTLENSKAHKVSVSIEEIENNMAVVTAGIQKGDDIIVTNLNSLQDGDIVKVSEGGK